MTMRILPAGDSALLVEVESLEAALAARAAIDEAALPGVDELVPAARTVLVRFRRGATRAEALAERIRGLTIDAAASAHGEHLELPVHYDGEDLDEVAGLLGLSVEALVDRHTAATWRVAFVGFAPGFAYLPGDDPLLEVPRRATPRTRIPAGSVAMAGRYSGVYPRESPGGWQLLGHTEVPMWDLDREPPALLRPGATVRFTRAEREAIHAGAGGTAQADAHAPTPPVAVTPTGVPSASPSTGDQEAAAGGLEIVRAGLPVLVQDLGRPGLAHLGVSASGAADARALRAANRAVGNASDAAALEIAGGAVELRSHADHVVAVTGALATARITTADGETLDVEHGRAIALEPGDRLRLGAVTRGLRVYVSVRGRLDIPTVLGSASTDTLAGLGPAPLRAGDRIDVVTAPGGAAGAGLEAVAVDGADAPPMPAPGDEVELDVVLGPRTDWFTAAAIDTLSAQSWLVTPASDRVGLRLDGETPLERAREGELESEGVVAGSIQVPRSGQPVLFLADCPLTGGYPVIGVVATHHLDAAGQLSPGTRIRFRPIRPFTDLGTTDSTNLGSEIQ